MDDQDYAMMRDKLLRAVEHACRTCPDPCVAAELITYDHPDECPCRCERVNGMLLAIEGLGTSNNT